MKARLALCQMPVTPDREKNYETAKTYLRWAGENHADFVALPEMWSVDFTPYLVPKSPEAVDGPAYTLMAEAAKTYGYYLIGGSVPFDEGKDKVKNRCFVFDRQGQCLGHYDKTHLFALEIKDELSITEANYTEPGKEIFLMDTEYGKVGIATCYDIRFPGLFIKMAQEGAKMVMLQAAFSYQTGGAHWETLAKARALDAQVFFAALGSAYSEEAHYKTFGHSMVVNPWGQVEGELGNQPGLLLVDIDFDQVDKARSQLLVLKHQRPELYEK